MLRSTSNNKINPVKSIKSLIQAETKRQQQTLMMIPSENYTYPEVREAVGSVLMHKYAEGLPGARYYQGNAVIDQVELMAQQSLLKAFGLKKDWQVNVQPHSGSEANLAALNGTINPGDTILSLYLPDGGHLSHGWRTEKAKVTLVGKIYDVHFYRVDPKTNLIDYQALEQAAKRLRPKVIISGGTSYPREIDHQKIGRIAHQNNALYLADVSHEAGLIAAKVNHSPFPHANIVTMTTHKTFRGPRGAAIFAKGDLITNINRGVFPGLQGGPHLNTTAGIAIAAQKTQSQAFKRYANQTVKNAQLLAKLLSQSGLKIVTKGTDKHLLLIDLSDAKHDGTSAALLLERIGIITNKNVIPYERGSAFKPSGLRLGIPAITVRGFKEKDITILAEIITQALLEPKPNLAQLKKEVQNLCKTYPISF